MAPLLISEAQRDVRRTYLGGFFGQLVSGVIWLAAAAVSTWGSTGTAVATLWLGGMLIFPLITLVLKASGRPAALPSGHPMAPLAMQIAFTVPLGLLVALALAVDRPDLFFPASMIIVGAHYLPFVFLYGMRLFAVLAALLASGGVALGTAVAAPASLGAWLTGAVLVVFAFLLRTSAREETHDA